jgi:hypothetical protein
MVVVVALGAGGIVAERHLAASPSPVNSRKADSPPRVEVVRPRRVTVARRLQTNATLEAFEEADLFAKVSGYLSDVRVDIGDHVKAGQVLAVIDVPEIRATTTSHPNDLGLSSSHQSCPDCIIATPGYDFREGQALDSGAIDSMTIVKLARCVTQTTKI